jgi:dUTP pyrophosphatase
VKLDFDLLVQRLHPSAVIPAYKSAGAGALDLAACEDVVIAPGERRVVKTGIAVAIPSGWAGWIKSRSGLCRDGFTVDGGLVDSDYTGELGIQCWNAHRPSRNLGPCRCGHGSVCHPGERASIGSLGSCLYCRCKDFVDSTRWAIHAGERIAQLVLLPVGIATVKVVDKLPETERGASGFGSSGVR